MNVSIWCITYSEHDSTARTSRVSTFDDPACFASPDLVLCTLLRALLTAPSTDPPHRPAVAADGPRWRKPFSWLPAPRLKSKTRQPAAVAPRRTVDFTRVAVLVGRSHSRQDCRSRWASEDARRRREGAGSAAQPARAGQTAGGRLAEPQVMLRTLWLVAPLAPRNLLLNACAHVVECTVVLCMVILNHIFDQVESLVCANDHWSNRQSSQWTMWSGARAPTCLMGGLGGVRRKRESYSGTF